MEVKPGYRRTEVGVIPDEWEIKRLKQISPRQCVGLVINPSTYYDKSGAVPLLVGSNISEGLIDAKAAGRISKVSNELLSASRLRAGDIVTVRVGEPGVSAVVPPELDGCNCASMMIIRQHPSFDSHWLCAVLNSPLGRRQVEHVQYGTAQKQFNISDAVDFTFAVPDLSEQRAIAQALRDVDSSLDGLKRLIAKKRSIKQAATQHLLSGEIRLPGFEPANQRFRTTEFGKIPDDWDVSTVGEQFYIQLGKMLNAEKNVGVMKPYLGNRAIQWDRIDVSKLSMMAMTRRDLAQFRLHKGDLLVCEGGEVGRAAVWDEPIEECYYQKALHRLRPRTGFNLRLMIVILSLMSQRGVFANYVTQTSIAHLPKERFLKVPIPVPKAEEQTAIAAILTNMDTELVALEKRLNKTRTVKQAMMQELLTGKTRLVKPEPAA